MLSTLETDEISAPNLPVLVENDLPRTEYVVGEPPVFQRSEADNRRLTDTIPEYSTIDPQSQQELRDFEDLMYHLAEKARQNGQPVGLDYFVKYKPKFIDKAIGMAGAVGMAFLIPIAKRVTDKVGASPLYKPDGKNGGELMKITSMDPRIKLTPEENLKIKREGKSSKDRRILGRFGRILRSTSLDEVPQAAAVGWGLMGTVGPHSMRRMIDRAEESEIDRIYPDAHSLYREAQLNRVKKGIFGGYTAAARGKNEETQYLADAILLKYMCEAASPWIIGKSLKNALFRRGAK